MKTSFDTGEIISRKISPREKLLWYGSPSTSFSFSQIDIMRTISGLIWCLADLFMLNAFFLKTEGSAKLICLFVFALFFAVGLYMVFGSLLQKRKRQSTALYAITSERVIFTKITPNGEIKKMESIPLERAEDGNLLSGKNGIGTIAFWSTSTQMSYRNDNLAFYDIKDCDKVWDIFKSAKETKIFQKSSDNLNQ